MDTALLISGIVLPVAMIAGFIAVWRMPKRQGRREDGAPAWKDDSLDDWRNERDAIAEQEREARLQTEAAGLREGTARDEGETKRQQRIGG